MKIGTDSVALEIAMLKKGVTKKQVADALGISVQALYNKLNNAAEFKQSEIVKTSNLLKLGLKEREKIFFATNVE